MENEYRTVVNPDSLKGTKTEQNLHTALSGESQAYIRYKLFEAKAKQDGFVEISQIFCETAENEKEHAEIWFRHLGGWGTTEKNLETAAGGEHFEWQTMYSQFAEEAKAEGFDALAALFERVASIEKEHEARYEKYRQKILDGKTFSSDSDETEWICINCGYVVKGKNPPPMCPTCQHPQAYFKEKSEN